MQRRGKSTLRLTVYFFVAALIAAGGWWGVRAFITPRVDVTRPMRGPVVQAFYATGTVRPHREYPVKSATAGTLDKVLVDKGDRVKAGQPIAIVSDPSLVFQNAKAKGELDEKMQRVDPKTSPVLIEYDERLRISAERITIAQREVERVNKLIATSAASSVDLDRAMDAIKMLESDRAGLQQTRAAKVLELDRELQTARSAYNIAQWQLDEQTLKAPIDGVVLDRPTSKGTRVAVNDVIMRIANVSPANLVMRAQVDEEDVTKCNVGQTVRMSLYAFAGEKLSGTVKQVYDEADQDRRTFEVDVAFEQPDTKLAAGMTGELAFVIAEKAQATIIPSTALQGGKVYVVRNGKIAIAPDFKAGLRSFERIEASGLADDDRVVISPIGDITEGRQVRTTEVDPREATGVLKEQQISHGAASLKSFK